MVGGRRDGDKDRLILLALHAGLTRRPMPETVAGQIARLRFALADPSLQGKLMAASTSRGAASSMHDGWLLPDMSAWSQRIEVALDLFADWLAENPMAEPITADETELPRLRAFAAHLSPAIGKEPRVGGFRDNRRPRALRAREARWRGHRAYNKRFRFLERFDAKLDNLERELRLWDTQVIGKCGLILDIPPEPFIASPSAAAFTAYHAARRARRSVFTNLSQSQAFDTIAEALLDRCVADPTADWGLIARVHPAPAVLTRLSAAETDRLIVQWVAVLTDMAGQLEAAWRAGDFDLDTMIVRPGNDSSTWNKLAQAWNTARTAWFSLLAATGREALLNAVCPGKVMRLMAADVAAWHRSSGGQLHPDTQVWAALPKPWQVLRGEAACSAGRVAEACRAAGLDPAQSGWVEGRVASHAVAFTPTPELVNGVAVASPELALLLRNMGVFSGKPVRTPQSGLMARLKRLWGA